MLKLRIIASLSVLLLWNIASLSAGVINGGFEHRTGDQFDGWSTLLGLDSPTAAADSNQFAVFADLGFASQLE